MPDGDEPVADDELLYRRIPVAPGWYDNAGLSPEAFDPRKDEVTGISVSRAKYKSLADAAKGKGKQGYFIAVLSAGELRAHGIRVEPRPIPDDPSHAELPDLTCHNRNDTAVQEKKKLLAGLPLRIEGPFVPPTEQPP